MDFAACRGIAEGPVFIIASGASAKDFPMQRFANVPMITLNGAISMFPEQGPRPYFYVCTDTGFAHQQPDLYAKAVRLSQRLAIWPDEIESLPVPTKAQIFPLAKAARSRLYDMLFNPDPQVVRSRALWGSRSRSVGFSKDLSQGFFDARTVAYAALQIAFHLGFNQVFLVGVDLDQSVGRFYETSGQAVSRCHLDEAYERRILPSLKLMAEQVVDEHFAVYNLSATSRIPGAVIPKVTLDQAQAIILGSVPEAFLCSHPV
ncbi:lipopolysaccharide biosynthesis protein [Pseudomonas sp.]|uniref:lipopolysaccharide biosynthesis protein n=1 Tax=Pseudomonas sp. TaxID=306 RepID=UPI001B01C4FE|nr:lipopolysaccharide biosynthesis protein [Pseudomonas sp.]MBO9551989.1 lipopolysaccharide biosynthesis protein [Pseudomonas sp.]